MTNMWNFAPKIAVSMYPHVVKQVITPCVWGLSSASVQQMYDTYIQDSHLDVGAGPMLPEIQFHKKVTVMDINVAVLKSISDMHPYYNTTRGNLLNLQDYPQHTFSSIACFNVMHCVPEANKWEHFMSNTSKHICENGTLFGSTVLNTHPLSKVLNKLGVFHNTFDSAEDIKRIGNMFYDTVHVNTVGHELLFAFKKKNVSSSQTKD